MLKVVSCVTSLQNVMECYLVFLLLGMCWVVAISFRLYTSVSIVSGCYQNKFEFIFRQFQGCFWLNFVCWWF